MASSAVNNSGIKQSVKKQEASNNQSGLSEYSDCRQEESPARVVVSTNADVEFNSPTNTDDGQTKIGQVLDLDSHKRRPIEGDDTTTLSPTATTFKLSPTSSSSNSSSLSSNNNNNNNNNNTSLSFTSGGATSSNTSLNQTSFIFSPEKNLSIKVQRMIWQSRFYPLYY